MIFKGLDKFFICNILKFNVVILIIIDNKFFIGIDNKGVDGICMGIDGMR